MGADRPRRQVAGASVAAGDETTGELRAPQRLDPGTQAALMVLSGGDTGRFHRLPARFRIGRGDDVDLQINGPGVSRRHAEIERQADGTFVLRDLGSHNGTMVNGRSVASHSLRFGDQIDVGGDTRLRFVYRDEVDLHLQEAQRLEAVGQLAGGIAHEFNNLLAVVLGNLAWVRDELAARPDLRPLIDDCIGAARRGATLTHDLLSFARRSDVTRQPLDVGELVRGLATLLRSTFDRAIRIDADVPTGFMIQGDGSRLQQVLLNIAVNARDAMASGGALSISVDRVDRAEVVGLFGNDASAATYVRVRLRDTGHGMDAATQARIFEPFFTTKEIGHGTGLGLALAHGIIGSHHGAITVDSAPGAGTTFTVLLPEDTTAAMRQVDFAASSRPTLNVRGPTVAPAPEARTQTVLIVDDEPAIRRLAQHLLTAVGMKVLQAGDGAEAVEMLRRAPGTVGHVVLDVNMPQLDGEQVFKAIVALDPSVHVVVSSGNSEDERVRRIRTHPGVSWLPKPFDPAQLLAAVCAGVAQSED